MHQDMTKEAAEDILELPHRYTKEDLRRAYTKMARRYHPDAAALHHFEPAAAQALMVEANKAYDLLRQEFSDVPDRVVERADARVEPDVEGGVGIASGFANVNWRSGAEKSDNPYEDPWAFADDWGGDPPAEPVPLSLRSVLLGPVVLRVLLVCAFGALWFRTFPLLPHNLGRFVPDAAWTLMSVARLVAAMVYPTYLLAYELLSGNISNLVRETLNGMVSWVLRHYVDLRPKSSSYGCALYKLLREQVYALLMAPLALYAAAYFVEAPTVVLKVSWAVATAALSIDALAACARGGFVNVWSTALAERVESRYLLMRSGILKHCGQWR